jgi:hypothetical protein
MSSASSSDVLHGGSGLFLALNHSERLRDPLSPTVPDIKAIALT